MLTTEKKDTTAKLSPFVVRELIEKRDALINELVVQGLTNAEISWVFNISRQLVSYIINK